MSRSHHESDTESHGSPHDTSSSESDSDSVPKDFNKIKDPNKLLAIIHNMQAKANSRPSNSGSHTHLGDITNASTSKRANNKMRTRIDSEPETEPPALDNDSNEDSDHDSDDPRPSADDDESKIIHAGRKFVLTSGLWVHGNQHIFDEIIDPNFEILRGFFRMVFGAKGRLWFMYGVGSQLGNTSTRLRRAAGAAIFNCGPADLLLPNARVKNFRENIGWHVVDDAGSYSSLDVPILHAAWNGKYDPKSFFLNPVLMRVACGIIWTARPFISSKTATQSINPSTHRAAQGWLNLEGFDVLPWCPYSLDMSIIENLWDHLELMAIWALSGDTNLRTPGDCTGIDYQERFEEYLEVLLTGLELKRKSILNVFREWDRVLFPNAERGFGGSVRDGPSDGGNKRALDALRDEEDAEDGPGE
ncbi:hypothetical protein R3P38DRAFT_3471833 [Favolaschia claudopus]|uniref:Uncharacterized protein n=1 Tax=Favolaschia claudopus TaxID=2862362 RepID=A0AAV9ZCJ0_9AGAR